MSAQVALRANTLWPLLLRTGFLGAVLATALSSLSYIGLGAVNAVLEARGSSLYSAPTVWELTKATFLFSALTLVWCGPFGFFAGAMGAAVLRLGAGEFVR